MSIMFNLYNQFKKNKDFWNCMFIGIQRKKIFTKQNDKKRNLNTLIHLWQENRKSIDPNEMKYSIYAIMSNFSNMLKENKISDLFD